MRFFNRTVVSKDDYRVIVGDAVAGCYGVTGTSTALQPRPNLSLMFLRPKRQFVGRGIRIYKDGKGLMVDLHILILQGLNISATVRSIHARVRYTLEKATGLEVNKVNVFVDGMLKDFT